MSEEEYEGALSMEPSVYLDHSIISQSLPNTSKKTTVTYSVNSTTYCDDEQTTEEFVPFDLYAQKLTNLANRKLFLANEVQDDDAQIIYCSSPDIANDDEDHNQEFIITIQMLTFGLVINSNVFLSQEQWNTIVFIDTVLVKCVVCGLFSDVESTDTHIKSTAHMMKLDNYKPLARFDLSITRKIRDKYHCAVCNETFNLDADIQHFASKSHEGNLLSAINKVSDLNLDCVITDVTYKNNDTCHLNRNTINDRNKNYDCYHFNAAAIYRRDSSSASESFDSLDYDSDGNFFWDVDNNPQPGNSYATMLKKPKLIEMPSFLEKTLGNKCVKVKFDSWHMLISPKVNRFYCMVCKEYNHIRGKAEHCAESSHLENLEKCRIVTGFGDYLIREVDDKCYHCGHCNNLVINNDIEEHMEKYHSKFNKNAGDRAKNATKNNDNDNQRQAIANGILDNGAIENKSNDKIVDNDKKISIDNKENNFNAMNNNENNIKNEILFENVILTPFGYKITIPLLSLNVLCKRPNDYYCGLCNLICKEDMIIPHINSLIHMQLMQRTPFIVPFNCNLIRAIREALHCGICNLPIAATAIYFHINDPQHLQLLSKALILNGPGVIPNQTPVLPANVPIPPQFPLVIDPAVLAVRNNLPKQTETRLTESTIVPTKLDTKATNKTAKAKKNSHLKTVTTEPKETEITEQKNEEIDLNVSVESEVDLDNYVYVKLNNVYYKISVISYNTLVYLGDIKWYCFVCSSKVDEEELKKHVENRNHLENINKCKFLDKDGSLLRQIFLMYHCSTCNVLVSRKELKNHIIWPTHTEEITYMQNISKKTRKNEVKSGTNMYIASTTKENIYLNEKEPETRLLFKIKITDNKNITINKKMKIVIVNGDVLKINFENWNGVASIRNGLKCQLCQEEFGEGELPVHVTSASHAKNLTGAVFKDNFLGDLMRLVNDTTLHCMVCNTEVSNKDNIVTEHISGKKHKKNYETIRSTSSTTSAYTDCDDEVLQL